LLAIERTVGRKLPRVTIPDFNYEAKVLTKLEIPLKDRIAEIRARKADDRKRAADKAARRSGAGGGGSARSKPSDGAGRTSAAGPSGQARQASAGGSSPYKAEPEGNWRRRRRPK
jgi:ATP-dependent RNA helicase RhlE